MLLQHARGTLKIFLLGARGNSSSYVIVFLSHGLEQVKCLVRVAAEEVSQLLNVILFVCFISCSTS